MVYTAALHIHRYVTLQNPPLVGLLVFASGRLGFIPRGVYEWAELTFSPSSAVVVKRFVSQVTLHEVTRLYIPSREAGTFFLGTEAKPTLARWELGQFCGSGHITPAFTSGERIPGKKPIPLCHLAFSVHTLSGRPNEPGQTQDSVTWPHIGPLKAGKTQGRLRWRQVRCACVKHRPLTAGRHIWDLSTR
jgi:hypothetical protein